MLIFGDRHFLLRSLPNVTCWDLTMCTRWWTLSNASWLPATPHSISTERHFKWRFNWAEGNKRTALISISVIPSRPKADTSLPFHHQCAAGSLIRISYSRHKVRSFLLEKSHRNFSKLAEDTEFEILFLFFQHSINKITRLSRTTVTYTCSWIWEGPARSGAATSPVTYCQRWHSLQRNINIELWL